MFYFGAAAGLPEHKTLVRQLQNVPTRKAVRLTIFLDCDIRLPGLLIRKTEDTVCGKEIRIIHRRQAGKPCTRAPIVEGRGVGIRIFDGQGNFTEIVSVKGVNTPALIDQRNFGTYKINPDCTGTAFLTVPGSPGPAGEFRLVVVNNGKEIFFTLVNPVGPMTLTHAVRM